MTTYASQKFQCFMCGAVHEFKVLASTNSFGPADLDLRPGPMKRWTMDTWVQECPECGYVSDIISDYTEITPEFLKSEAYLSCNGINFKSKLAVLFYRRYLIMQKHDYTEAQFDAALQAAWCCDDENDPENAIRCRELAIPLLTEMIASEKEYLDDMPSDLNQTSRILVRRTEKLNNYLLMKADLLRRAGHFDRLIEEYENVRFSDPLLDRILAFEIEKARQEDTNRYSVRDVTMNDPR